jgi:hypothetical protein
MGPGVPQESQQLVCVCANEFAQTSAHLHSGGFVADASAPCRTTAAKLLSKDKARGLRPFRLATFLWLMPPNGWRGGLVC